MWDKVTVFRDGVQLGSYSRREFMSMLDVGLIHNGDMVRNDATGEMSSVSALLSGAPKPQAGNRGPAGKAAPMSGQGRKNSNLTASQPRPPTSAVTFLLRSLGVITLVVGILQTFLPYDNPVHYYIMVPLFSRNPYSEELLSYCGPVAIAVGLFLLRTGIFSGRSHFLDVAFGMLAIGHITLVALSFLLSVGYSLVPSLDPFVSVAKRTQSMFCDRKVGDLVGRFFESPKWEVSVDRDGTRHVSVRGEINFNGISSNAELKFSVKDGASELESTFINGVEAPASVARRLWNKMCDTSD